MSSAAPRRASTAATAHVARIGVPAAARAGVPWWNWAASAGVHAILLGAIGWLALRPARSGDLAPRSAPDEPINVEVAPSPPPSAAARLPAAGAADREPRESPPDPAGIPPLARAGALIPRPDTGKRGAGGEATTREQAVNLSDGDERMRLSPDLLSRLDRDQLQRVMVAQIRRSWEDRRSTTHPTELSFLASGTGPLAQRRPLAPSDPSRGALRAPRASIPGSELGALPDAPDATDATDATALHAGSDHRGATTAGAGAGIAAAPPGADHRTSARVAHARPDVTQAPIAVNANDTGRPEDTVDTEQEVATTVRALVHASTAGGREGEGQGGNGAGGDSGAGGVRGTGSQSSALGDGEGDTFDINTSDPRLVPYFRQIQAKVHPLWANAFPRSAVIDLKQGFVILVVAIAANGNVHVAWPPLRPSGIPEFDRNCADALHRAGPFPPIPASLARSQLRVALRFNAVNPIVQ